MTIDASTRDFIIFLKFWTQDDRGYRRGVNENKSSSFTFKHSRDLLNPATKRLRGKLIRGSHWK